MLGPLARRAAMGYDDRRLAVESGLRSHRLSVAAAERQQHQRGEPAPHAAKRCCQSSAENPTLNAPSASTSGRRIIAGCSSISALADAASSPSFCASGSLRKVVPLLLSSFSQPRAAIHPCNCPAVTPSFALSGTRSEYGKKAC